MKIEKCFQDVLHDICLSASYSKFPTFTSFLGCEKSILGRLPAGNSTWKMNKKWPNLGGFTVLKTVDDDVFSMTMLNYVRLREDNGIPGYHENTTATPKKIVFKCFQDVMQSHLFYPFWCQKSCGSSWDPSHLGDLPCLELGIGQPNNAANEENVHHHLLHQNLPRSQVTIVTKVFPRKSWPKLGPRNYYWIVRIENKTWTRMNTKLLGVPENSSSTSSHFHSELWLNSLTWRFSMTPWETHRRVTTSWCSAPSGLCCICTSRRKICRSMSPAMCYQHQRHIRGVQT